MTGIAVTNTQPIAQQPTDDQPELFCYIYRLSTAEKVKMRKYIVYHRERAATKYAMAKFTNGASVCDIEDDAPIGLAVTR